MWWPRLVIRPDERRDTAAAFLTLFGFVASHAMLETARDALFLAKVPATHLPWVFLAIAGCSLALASLQQRFAARLVGRAALVAWIALAGVVTLGFWLLLPRLGSAGVYALYVWSGVLSALVLVQFWILLGTLFSITQAKRLYGIVGAGSVLGAIAGSGAASALAQLGDARHLVLVAAAGFTATALVPLRFARNAAPTAATAAAASLAAAPAASLSSSLFTSSPSAAEGEGLWSHARFVARQPYPRKLALLVILATTCVTLADFLFKSTIAAQVPAEDLGATFATIAFVLNLASLVVQVGLVGLLVRRAGVTGALAVLPVLLALSGLGMIVAGGLVAAIALKGADGALRYSLHRTASELVFLPLGEAARRRTKAFIDVVGHRGSQALAALAILALGALAAPPEVVAGLLVALAILWIVTASSLRAPYLDLFRTRLRSGRRLDPDDELLDLDVASFETLLRALDSEADGEVLAALDVFEQEGKSELVPALILYHPSDLVVERALELFTRARRTKIVPILDRLAEHASPRIRAIALASRSVLDPDARPLHLRLSFEDSPEVRAAIIVNLIAMNEITGSDARDRLDAILRHGTLATQIALADAIARRAADGFADVLATLARHPDEKLQLAALRAIGRCRTPSCLGLVIEMLGREPTREPAQQVLLDYGTPGFHALVAAIDDPTLPAVTRIRLPRALAAFDPEPASAVLLEWLTREQDGAVRYQVQRALERLVRRVPSILLDRDVLDRTIDGTVSRAYRYLDRRLILARGAAADPARATPGHDALVTLLRDKEANAVARIFGMLGLAYRTDDFAEIHRGLTSPRKDARATSMELIENVLPEPLRSAVLGLVDDLPAPDRLAAGARYHTPLDLDYDDLLGHMLESTSESVQDLTVFHIGELGLVDFQPRIAALATSANRSDVARTLAILDLASHREAS
jgi:ATP:ADP antiporter, AAA family